MTLRDYINSAFLGHDQATRDRMLTLCCEQCKLTPDVEMKDVPYWTRVGIVDIITDPELTPAAATA